MAADGDDPRSNAELLAWPHSGRRLKKRHGCLLRIALLVHHSGIVYSMNHGALNVLLQFLRTQGSGDPYAFRFEPQRYILPTYGGGSPEAHFEWSRSVQKDLESLRKTGRDPAVVQRFGELLRSFVKDAGWAQHEINIAQALAAHRPVFLTIRSSAAELYALPWELLTIRSGQFIGEVDNLLIRFEWPEAPVIEAAAALRLDEGRILVASAGSVPAAEHCRAIGRACSSGFLRFATRTDIIENASLGDIVQALEQAERCGPPVAILHLLCHGGADGSTHGVVLNGAKGLVTVSALDLRRELAPFAAMVRLVVLSACDSANPGAFDNRLGSIAQSLHRCGFQSVIGSRFPLSRAGSIWMTESLYSTLLSGPASLETAFLAARKRLARAESALPPHKRHMDWASLQLYACHAHGDDTRPLVFRPFRGLLAFQPEHHRFFFGREKEVTQLLANLAALVENKKARFLIVAGASGIGKSSLVFAGAVPKLLAQNPELTFLRMRPGGDPMRALDEALAQRREGKTVLLVVDQFEELFTQVTHKEASAVRSLFVSRLWELASTIEQDISIIVTLRIDFIGRCGELVVNADGLTLDLVAYEEGFRVFVPQLQPEQLIASIVQPAQKVGLELEPGLAERMLQEVAAEPGALPLLEDVLDVIWQRRNQRWLTQAAFQAMGGVIGALQKRADAVIGAMEDGERLLARQLLVSLVAVADDTALDSRLRVPLAELAKSVGDHNAIKFERVLKELVAARLLVQDGDKGAESVEVAHEALIRKWPQLRIEIEENRAGLLIQRRVQRIAKEWEDQQYGDDSLLYRGTQLAQAMEWRQTWGGRVTDRERKFLDASRELQIKEERERAAQELRERETAEQLSAEKQQKLAAAQLLARRTRLAALVLGVLFLGASVATVLAWQAKRTAELSSQQERGGRSTLLARLLPGSLEALALGIEAAAPSLASGRRLPAAVSEGILVGASAPGYPLIPPLRHEGELLLARFTQDGQKLITYSKKGELRLWDIESGKELRRLQSTVSYVGSAMLPDGHSAAFISPDGSVHVWQLDTAQPAKVWFSPRQPAGAVEYGALSPDGARLLTLVGKEGVRVWDARPGPNQGVLLFSLLSDAAALSLASFSPSGDRIITADAAGFVRIWEVRDGVEQRPPEVSFRATPAGAGELKMASLSPDNRMVVTAHEDGTARVWVVHGNPAPGAESFALKGHANTVRSAIFSHDGRYIVTASNDGTARVWDAEEGRTQGDLLFILRGHFNLVVGALFSPTGRQIVTVSSDHTARVWDASGRAELSVFSRHTDHVGQAVFSPDGTKVLTASWDGTAGLWEVSSGQRLRVLGERGSGAVYAAAFSPDGSKVATAHKAAVARLWDVYGDRAPLVLTMPPDGGEVKSVLVANFSPNGTRLVTAGADGITRLWDVADGRKLMDLVPPTMPTRFKAICDAEFSSDGNQLVTASHSGWSRTWNVHSGALIASVIGKEVRGLSTARFSPDGREIVTAGLDGIARTWDATKGVVHLELRGHDASVAQAKFSPDGTVVATVSQDGSARIWRTANGALLHELNADLGRLTAVAFSPDGKTLATAGKDGTAQLWDIEAGERTAIFAGHIGAIVDVQFRSDGKAIVTAGDDGTSRVYSTELSYYLNRACTLLHRHPLLFTRVAKTCLPVIGSHAT